jgi:hypothetical protein
VLDAFDPWNKKYGYQLPDGTYQISAAWQAGLSNVRLDLGFHFTLPLYLT